MIEMADSSGHIIHNPKNMRGGLFFIVGIFCLGAFLFGALSVEAAGSEDVFMEFRFREEGENSQSNACRADVLFEDRLIVFLNRACLLSDASSSGKDNNPIGSGLNATPIVNSVLTVPVLNLVDEIAIEPNKVDSKIEVGSDNAVPETLISKIATPEIQTKSQESAIVEKAVVMKDNSNLSEGVSPIVKISSGDVVVNELVSDPELGGKEWIELYNRLDREIDIAGWYILEGSGVKVSLFGKLSANGFLTFEAKSLNNAGDVVKLYSNEKALIHEVVYGSWDDGLLADNHSAPMKGASLARVDDGSYYVSITPTKDHKNIINPLIVIPDKLITPKATEVKEDKKSETGEAIPKLGDEPIIDSIEDGPSPVVDFKPNQILPSSIIIGIDPKSLLEDAGETTSKHVFQYGDLQITELYADPDGDEVAEEFIELHNMTKHDLDIKSLRLQDRSGKRFMFGNSTIIKSGSYEVFFRTQSGIILNNTSDEVALFDASDRLIHKVAYQDSKEKSSYQKILDDKYDWLSMPTPGAEAASIKLAFVASSDIISSSIKELSSVDDLEILSLDEARSLREVGDRVHVIGRIVAEPGIFEKGVFYIGDDIGGIQVTISSSMDGSLYKEGYLIDVIGVLSLRYGEMRIKVSSDDDIRVIERGGFVNGIQAILSDVETSLEGVLVSASGRVVDYKKKIMVIASDDGELRVSMKHLDNFEGGFSIDDEVKITGIVRLGRDSIYYLTPRDPSDIRLLKGVANVVETFVSEAQKPAFQKSKDGLSVWWYVLFALIFPTGIFAYKKTRWALAHDYFRNIKNLFVRRGGSPL